MRFRREEDARHPEHFGLSGEFVQLVLASIELVVEFRILDMQFLLLSGSISDVPNQQALVETYSRVDPDNGTVLLMHFGDLPLERSAFDEIVVEFGPISQSGQFGAGEIGQRAEVQSSEDSSHDVSSKNTD